MSVTTVLFACIQNTGRSQMAAALFNAAADPAKAHAISAGTDPGPHVHPAVVAVMREVGLELADVRPRRLTEALATDAQLLVTMGCGEACPVVAGLDRGTHRSRQPRRRNRSSTRRRISSRISRTLEAG